MKSPIIVALDYPELDMATGMLDRLDPDMTRVKVGKEMFTRFGPAMVEACMQRGNTLEQLDVDANRHRS